ncbi:hypothetical protein JCM10213v2_007186 [Rhodosporidiobolus nylandii]
MGKTEDHQAAVQEAVVPKQYQAVETKTGWARIYDVLAIDDAEERRMLYKLDAVLVSFMFLGYFLKYLDQSNINSAYVSGMKEDLGMFNNELTTAITLWTVGYVAFQIPATVILTRVSPRWWLPALEIGWGICTLSTYKVSTVRGLYTVRFFVGLFEAGFYPCAQFILGSFYSPAELGKRAVLFHTAGGIGTLISSVLQAAAYTNLDGVHGHKGWQWLFIIDAVVTLPIAILGLVFLPALPGQREAGKGTWWLSKREWDIIDRRIASFGRAPARKLTWNRVKSFGKNWHIYLLPVMYILWNNSLNASTVMAIWLKSFNLTDTGTGITYTIPQINHLVMPITGVYCITAYFFAWTSDGWLRGRRWPPIVFTTLLNAAVVLALVNLPLYKHLAAHFVLYYMTQIGGGMSGLLFSWASEICSADNEERSLVIALMNTLAYVQQAIVPDFTWKQTDYPKCTIGYWYSFGLSIALFFWVFLVRHLHHRDRDLAARQYVASEPSSPAVSTGELDKDAELALEAERR